MSRVGLHSLARLGRLIRVKSSAGLAPVVGVPIPSEEARGGRFPSPNSTDSFPAYRGHEAEHAVGSNNYRSCVPPEAVMFNWWAKHVNDRKTQELLRETNALLYDVRYHLRRLNRPKRPFHVIVTPLQETHMSQDILTYAVALAPITEPSDVVKRHLNVEVDGAELVHQETTPAENAFAPINVPQDSVVKLTFVDEDDAGNLSAPLEYEFTAKDEIPPAQPTGLSVTPAGEQPGDEYTG